VTQAASVRENSTDQTSIHRDLHSITCNNRGFGLDSGTRYRRPPVDAAAWRS
jgi:hypothetical protein